VRGETVARSSGAIVVGPRHLVRDGLDLIELFQHVFDVARQLLGCEPLRAQRKEEPMRERE